VSAVGQVGVGLGAGVTALLVAGLGAAAVLGGGPVGVGGEVVLVHPAAASAATARRDAVVRRGMRGTDTSRDIARRARGCSSPRRRYGLRVLTRHVAPHVAALTVHPVKSFAGLPSSTVDIVRSGVRGDRRWMVVDAHDGGTLTARRDPVMLSARATPQDDGAIVLDAPGVAALRVAVPDGPPDRATTMSRLDRATDAGDAAAAWCSELLAKDVRLVWLDDPARRGMSEKHGGTRADPLALTDTGPVHVTTTASLRRLDEWAAQVHDEVVAQALAAGDPAPDAYRALDMRRFRPNLVVDGDLQPFEEDGWSRLVVGDVELRFADRCGRCVMTTIDPDTLLTGREPLRTLARHRRGDGEVWFGIQMVPVRPGRVQVGDPVVVA